jgi:membrane protein required for beta-lactamase induction
MDIARMVGIGIIMIIPTFVGAGALWEVLHSWFAVLIWILFMGGFTGALLAGKLSGKLSESNKRLGGSLR